jgi:predicted metal-binding protein
MFDATPSDAQAIVDYAIMHSESETGQVPFRQWPIGVKGHFVSRHIPLPEQN